MLYTVPLMIGGTLQGAIVDGGQTIYRQRRDDSSLLAVARHRRLHEVAWRTWSLPITSIKWSIPNPRLWRSLATTGYCSQRPFYCSGAIHHGGHCPAPEQSK